VIAVGRVLAAVTAPQAHRYLPNDSRPTPTATDTSNPEPRSNYLTRGVHVSGHVDVGVFQERLLTALGRLR